jgi:adenylate cyclase
MAAVLALVVAGAVAFIHTAPAFEPASVKAMAFPLPEKPSLAVLPLDNLSGDASQDVLAAGLTEAIVTTLAKVPDLFVIDRNSTATFKDKPAGIKEVAEALGVRYVLEGSVQRSGDRVRISAHLADALSGRSVWSEDYDSELADIFDLQDEITRQVMTELQVKLTQGKQAELRRHQTRSADAYMAFLQGVEVHNELTNEAQVKAQELLGRAV